MQDTNNPNISNTNAFPIPPNDAPATFSGSNVSVPAAPVVPIVPESPQIISTLEPVIASVAVPVDPIPLTEPVQPEPMPSPSPIIESATQIQTPVVESSPFTPPTTNRFDIPQQPVMPVALAPVLEPVVPSQAPPAPISLPIVQPQPQPLPVAPAPISIEPIMPVMTPPSVQEPVVPLAPPAPIYKAENIPAVSLPPAPSFAVAPAVLPVQSSPVASILTPPPPMPIQPVTQGVPAISVAPTFTKKSPFPKIALIAAAILLVLSGILFVVMQFMGGGGGATVGTKGEIVWWGITLDEQSVAPIIADYTSNHPDVKITYVKQSKEEYRERLTNALAKSTGAPDIFEMHNSWQPMFKNDLATLPSALMTPDEYKGTFYPIIVQDMTTPKGIIGMPLYYDALTLYVNEDLFSVALKLPPKTWIEVQALANPATGITQKEKDGRIIQSAIALGTTDNVEYWPDILGLMMHQNKAKFTDFEATTTKDTFAFYKYFGPTIGNWDSTLPKSTEAFAKSKTAMIIAPASAAYDIIQAAPTLHFKTYPLPQLPKENPSDPNISYATYWVEGVWTKSASRDAAWEFLKYASSGETLQKVNQN